MDGMQHLAALAGAQNIDLRTLAQLFQQIGAQNSKGGQDTILAHINPQEYQLLLQQGGSGRVDPMTGLPHFDDAGGDSGGGDGDGGGGPGDGGGQGGSGGGERGGDDAGGGGGPGDGGFGGGERGNDAPGGGGGPGTGATEGGGFADGQASDAGGFSVGRTSTDLSQADLSSLGLSGYAFGGPGQSTRDFEPNSLGFGFLGFTPGTVASPEGLLDGTRTRDMAVGFSPTALGLDAVSAMTGLPAGLAARAFGYTPTDYSTVATLGGMPGIGGMAMGGGQASADAGGYGGGDGGGSWGGAGAGMGQQTPETAMTTPRASNPSILSVLQSLFGTDKIYGVTR